LKTGTLFSRALFHQQQKRARKGRRKKCGTEQGHETCTKWTVMDLKPAKQKHKIFEVF